MKTLPLVTNVLIFASLGAAGGLERRVNTISNPKTPPVTVNGNGE
jgi:hypothetical protein